MAAEAAVRRGWRAVVWYLRELTGESAYEHYLRHRAERCRRGPAEPLLTRREFERRRMERQAGTPGTRCC